MSVTGLNDQGHNLKSNLFKIDTKSGAHLNFCGKYSELLIQYWFHNKFDFSTSMYISNRVFMHL